MANEIISYREMCNRESTSLQRGMNFNLGGSYSVILMSVRGNAPYRDRFEEQGTVLIYEGHDVSKSTDVPDPKRVDQLDKTARGSFTENGKFAAAALNSKNGEAEPHLVRVYEKIHTGIWSYNGVFQLIDAIHVFDGTRYVFEFKLAAIAGEVSSPRVYGERRRIIPTDVKVEVWRRDGGRCVKCGADDELHFDHDLPYSLGGTSMTAANVQLLCARHNLSKGAQID